MCDLVSRSEFPVQLGAASLGAGRQPGPDSLGQVRGHMVAAGAQRDTQALRPGLLGQGLNPSALSSVWLCEEPDNFIAAQ